MRRLAVLGFAGAACAALVAVTRYDKGAAPGASFGDNVIAAPATAAAPLPKQKTAIGLNLSTVAYWTAERSFMNLAAGGGWSSIMGGWSEMPANRLDARGTVLSLRPGEQAALALTRPPRSYDADLAVRCTYKGQGKVAGVATFNLRASPGRIDFIWRPDVRTAYFKIEETNPADPVRAIDCREADADPRALFDPAFVKELSAYKAVRFMDWSLANLNEAGDWSRRTPADAFIQQSRQGVAVEHMVALANEAGVDPWFTLPWKADALYVASFARYVHEHLDLKRTAYIEVGNEIWNLDFPAARQARDEGMKLRLSADENEARMRRYAQRSIEVFTIWEQVYADRPKGIVRILSGQNAWPGLVEYALNYKDMAKHIDALSSALYFAQTVLADPKTPTSDLGPIFAAIDASIPETFKTARQFKQMADARGLRYIGYEGGQHATYNGPDKTLMERLNRDPRMGASYRRFLTGWDREFGDLLMLYHSTSPIGTTMHFGMAEHSGQPLSETPKRKAVLDAIAELPR
ncbi:MAG: hypothetical protein ACOY5R_03895 [Pseudomonadota bacterium]